MNAFVAVLIDTWHESKRQIVFRLLVALMVLVTVVAIAMPRRFDAAPGGEPALGIVFVDEPVEIFEEMWWAAYLSAEVRALDLDTPKPTSTEYRDWAQARREAAKKGNELTSYERGAQMWFAMSVSSLFKIAMLGFIAACAGYFPHLMREGAVDAVVSKPAGRLAVFAGKFAGGLLLFVLALTACHVLLYVGLGWRLGIWHERIFLSLGFEIFVACVLYAFLACAGIISRSAVLATVLGYGYYLVIDTGLGAAIQLIGTGMIGENNRLKTAIEWARRLIPNFSVLNDATVATVITMPHLDWEPFATAGFWTVLTLTAGYVAFRNRDF